MRCILQKTLAVFLIAAAGATAGDSPATLIFAGDIMLDDKPGECIAKGTDVFAEFDSVLRSAEVRIGNLECVVSTCGKPIEGKPWTFQPHPRVLPVLARHFEIVSLANNHTGDFGHEAFIEQLDLLDRHHIRWFGGGRNCLEARTPHIVTTHGLRIALLGYNDFHPREFEAGPSWPGTAWCVDEQILADLAAARSIHHADLVIPFMHWGDEEEPANDRQKALARRMIDAGADLVVGGHPHVTQGAEYYKGRLIVYSLGNFVFDGFDEGPGRTGWLLRLALDRGGLSSWDTVVARLDDNGIPRPDPAAASPGGDARAGTIGQFKALTDSPFTRMAAAKPAPDKASGPEKEGPKP